MSRRIAILAALPSELKPLVRGWERVSSPQYMHMWRRVDADGDELVAVCAGIGADAARRAFLAAEASGPLDLVVSVGLAGSTNAELGLGSVSAVTEIIDVKTGERFSLTTSGRKLRLATATGAANAPEKRRLFASYGAVLVDMEGATIARLAAMRDLPISCFKAVSDAPDAVLPDIDRFTDANGQLQTLRFVLYIAVRPRFWKAVAALARGSRLASDALAVQLREFLRHKDWAYTNATGNFTKSG